MSPLPFRAVRPALALGALVAVLLPVPGLAQRSAGALATIVVTAQRNPEDGGLGCDYALVGEPRTCGPEVTVRY